MAILSQHTQRYKVGKLGWSGRFQYSDHLLCDISSDTHLCLFGRCSKVRSSNHPLMSKQLFQHCVITDGLLAKHIEGSTCELTLIESIQECFFINQAPSCAVNQAC